jgi:hypothetical protein
MTTKPQLAPEQRQQLETLLRHQIAAVKATCAILGRPAPILSREERREQRKDRTSRT